MSNLSVTELIEHVETDLGEAALQRLIDAEEEDVGAILGPYPTIYRAELEGGGKFLFLPTQATDDDIEVVEIIGTTETTLAANDWRLAYNDRALERLATGTNARSTWAARVRVEYVPVSSARRKAMTIDLVKLALQHNAVRQESIGDHQQTSVDYQAERQKIISRGNNARRAFA